MINSAQKRKIVMLKKIKNFFSFIYGYILLVILVLYYTKDFEEGLRLEDGEKCENRMKSNDLE